MLKNFKGNIFPGGLHRVSRMDRIQSVKSKVRAPHLGEEGTGGYGRIQGLSTEWLLTGMEFLRLGLLGKFSGEKN